jgi:transposase-like protein
MCTFLYKKSSKVFLLDMKTTKEKYPYCLGSNLRPKGWNRKRTKRRKKCADCKRHITQGGKSWFVGNDQIELQPTERAIIKSQI